MIAAPVSCRRQIQKIPKTNEDLDDSANHFGNVCILSAGVPTMAHRQSSKNQRHKDKIQTIQNSFPGLDEITQL